MLWTLIKLAVVLAGAWCIYDIYRLNRDMIWTFLREKVWKGDWKTRFGKPGLIAQYVLAALTGLYILSWVWTVLSRIFAALGWIWKIVTWPFRAAYALITGIGDQFHYVTEAWDYAVKTWNLYWDTEWTLIGSVSTFAHYAVAALATIVALMVVVLILMAITKVVSAIYRKLKGLKKPAKTGSTKAPAEDKRWWPILIAPAGYAYMVKFMGREYRSHRKWLVKAPGLETVRLVPIKNYIIEGETTMINTAGHKYTQQVAEVASYVGSAEPAYHEQVGSEAMFRALLRVGMDDPVALLYEDPALFAEMTNTELTMDERKLLKKVVFATLSASVKEGQPKLRLEDGQVLPAEIILAAQTAHDIHGPLVENINKPMDDDERIIMTDDLKRDLSVDGATSRWGQQLNTTLDTIGLKLSKISLSNKRHIRAIGETFPTSAVARLAEMGLGIANFELGDFEPQTSAKALIQERTDEKLRLEVNRVTLQKDLESAHGKRAVREQLAIGSGRTVTAQLEQVQNWLWTNTGGLFMDEVNPHFDASRPESLSNWKTRNVRDMVNSPESAVVWTPDPDKVESYIPAFEFMRRWEHSDNSTIFYGLAELVPELGKLFQSRGLLNS